VWVQQLAIEEVLIEEDKVEEATISEVPATSALVAAKQYWQHGCEVPSLRLYL
jgi:hypothetical protein